MHSAADVSKYMLIRTRFDGLSRLGDIPADFGNRVSGAQKQNGTRERKQDEGQHRRSFAHGNDLWLSGYGWG